LIFKFELWLLFV